MTLRRWGVRVILGVGLLAACRPAGPSTADLARIESVWQAAADSATRSACADSLAHGRSRCTTVHGADTLFIWGDSAHRAAGFIRVHPVGRAGQDSAATALREQLAATLGPGVQCTVQVHGWSVGPASVMVVRRPDGGVVLVLGTHQQAAIVCPGLGDRE
ncbi:MAG TPA: hypothetical protein VFU45_09940 [Gemmatimonadales bacterium]|nr:hypothetical protein [Gemmatimonadales bacterium]